MSAELISPFRLVVELSSSAVACVAVRSSTFPVPAVVRHLNDAVAIVACFAFVTTQLSIVHTVPLDDTVTSPLSPSVRAGIVISQLPRTITEFIVLMLVQDTSVSCFPAISAASSLSVFNVLKLVVILDNDIGFSVSVDAIVCSVLIILLCVRYKLLVVLLYTGHSKFGSLSYPKSAIIVQPKSVLHKPDYLYKLFQINLLHHSKIYQFLTK